MKENILKEKSFLFAIRIVHLYKYLAEEKREFVLSKQLLRSGTSVGAAVREAEYAESNADFIHKMSVAQKEINETIYWIELLDKTNYCNGTDLIGINTDAVELLKIITSSIKTVKNKLN